MPEVATAEPPLHGVRVIAAREEMRRTGDGASHCVVAQEAQQTHDARWAVAERGNFGATSFAREPALAVGAGQLRAHPGRRNGPLESDEIMPQAFIIMQIGNAELDHACKEAIVPALTACGFDPKRVDKHNQGGLLKSEIIGFLERSEIIVADLTNERPNCYLEIGYAMGLGRFRNLVLTVREDHSPESPSYVRGGPKIHFDLAGYDILFWSANDLDAFRVELERKIRRRMAVVAPPEATAVPTWDPEWVSAQRGVALQGLSSAGGKAFMEARFALGPPKPTRTQRELDEAARGAQILTFGWPIAVYLGNRDELRPRPRADGIVAEVPIDRRYDYWAIRRNGDFYFLGSLFEDASDPSKLFFNTRIVRVTETLLYCARLYARLGVDPTARVSIAIRHGGLKGRTIGSSNPDRSLLPYAPAIEDEAEVEIKTSLQEIESNLVRLVKQLVAPVFVLFDFFEPGDSIYEEIVNSFVAGRIV